MTTNNYPCPRGICPRRWARISEAQKRRILSLPPLSVVQPGGAGPVVADPEPEMDTQAGLSGQDMSAYLGLVRSVAQGRNSPRWHEIARWADLSSRSGVSALLQRLEAAGLIRIGRDGHHRTIGIVETGEREAA